MAELWNKTQNKMIVSQLVTASRLIDRGIGLLKYKKLEDLQGLWIHQCNSIHTFFMRFTIDCVFVDKNLLAQASKLKSDFSEIVFLTKSRFVQHNAK